MSSTAVVLLVTGCGLLTGSLGSRKGFLEATVAVGGLFAWKGNCCMVGSTLRGELEWELSRLRKGLLEERFRARWVGGWWRSVCKHERTVSI